MRDHASRGNHAERKKEEASAECRGEEYFLDKAICRLASAPLAKFGKVHRLVGGNGPLGRRAGRRLVALLPTDACIVFPVAFIEHRR